MHKTIKIIGCLVLLAVAPAEMRAQQQDTITETVEVAQPEQVQSIPVADLTKDSSYLQQKKFEADFKERYSGEEFDYTYERQSKRGFIERLIQRIKEFFGYVDRNTISTYSFFESTFFKIASGIVILLALAFVIRLLILNDFNRFFKKASKKTAVEIIDIEEQLHQVDFEKLLQQTLQNGANRLAIRYYYLWLLKRLSNAEIIEWHSEKTNADYLYEIKDPSLKHSFEYLSYLYNNIWYGEFEISQEEFTQAQQAFITVLNTYKAHE